MLNVAAAVAILSGLAIVVAVCLQKTKADGFSAAMGGGSDTTRHTPGSKEAWLDMVAKYAAIVWVLACLIVAIMWYG
jgi:protein translocase SecG subunit